MHRRNGNLILAATDLVAFLNCGHLTRLDLAAAYGHIRKPDRSEDPEVELLQRRGTAHEQRYVEQLRADGRRITDLSAYHDATDEERAERTIEAMRRGDDVIYQAFVFDGRWLGYPDFLVRVDGARDRGDQLAPHSIGESARVINPQRSREGTQGMGIDGAGSIGGGLGADWHYEIADTKLAHTAKASALVQICSYVEQIERIQGVQPENVYVVTGGAQIERHAFRTAEMMAYYRHARRRFEAALAAVGAGADVWPIPRTASYPDPVEHCSVCRWYYERCRPQWREDDALPLVAGIGRKQRELLALNDVATMTALSELYGPPIELPGVKRSHADALWKMREQARLQVKTGASDVPAYELLEPEPAPGGGWLADRGLSALPTPDPGDLFFDIEGDPFAFWEGLEYLFGIWELGSGDSLWDQPRYSGLWAMDRAAEKRAFEQVVDTFAARRQRFPEMHVYHYGSYEPSRLKALAGRHATREDELDQLLRGRVFVDLFRVVKQGVLVGAERYSIKNLEPLYGYGREIELRDANSSIVEFEKLLEFGDPDGELRRKIEFYNRDDCISAERLRSWLEARREDAAQVWGDLPRPRLAAEEGPSEHLSEWIRRVNDLHERLTAPIAADPRAQSDADKATWLVAHLLDWHRREDKSTWWRYYELLSKTDDELFEEAEPIGRLEYIGIVEDAGTKLSDDHRYRFPPQEHKLEAGYDADDPRLESDSKRTGKVQAIDDVAGTIDIRRKKDWTGPHPRSVIQVNVIPATEQREALMRLGEWIVANGIDADAPEFSAARDLLRRRPPRVLGRVRGEDLKRGGETGSEAALRLATQLDGTTLAIQGPPGSGKTYIGARMILELVRAGRRAARPRPVGITSNSHKVVSNLIEAVLDAARDEGETVRVIQKGKEDEVYRHPSVKRANANGEVADALAAAEADIAAGTPWLWADDKLLDAIDTLFVDEAGQVSLANVVAVSGAARNVVLLGDPQQLDQPTQGVHPGGAGVSALTHLLGELETVPPDRGLFLERTWRMHPEITAYTSELFYEGKLDSFPGLERQEVLAEALPSGFEWLAGAGLRWVEVVHDGNTNASIEEAARVYEIWNALVGQQWVEADGARRMIGPQDIVIVSPFNAHRILIQERLGPAARIGTVDKFQGQEAPVSIYTMATSRPEDAPRGMNFLYSLNRLNVATSRARALAIVVASPRLLSAVARTPTQLRMANGLAAFVESATEAQRGVVARRASHSGAPDSAEPRSSGPCRSAQQHYRRNPH